VRFFFFQTAMAALRAHCFFTTDTIYYTITVRRLQNAEGTNFEAVRL
jgi:hypothetical protein